MSWIQEKRDEHAAKVKSLRAIAEKAEAERRDLTAAEAKQADDLNTELKTIARDIKRAEQSEQTKAALAAIGFDLSGLDRSLTEGLGSPEDSKNLIMHTAKNGTYKQRAAGQWAVKAAERVGKAIELLGDMKSIVPASISVPDIVTGPVELAEERHTILNLIPTKTATGESLAGTGGNVFGYPVQTTRTNNANAVLPGGLKPESVYQWATRVDRFRKIAHRSEPQPDEILADYPTLITFLTEEMGRGVLDELESQILNGTGTISGNADGTPTVAEEQLPGILNTSGVQAQAWDTDLLTTLAAAYDKLVLANEEPTAWVMHPLDYRRLKNMREDGTTGPLMFKSGRSSIEQILGEIPVITTALIAQGTALVGDFRKTLLVTRDDVKITASNGDSTLFDYNLTKYIAEGRFGFAVLRPNAFVVVDLTAA